MKRISTMVFAATLVISVAMAQTAKKGTPAAGPAHQGMAANSGGDAKGAVTKLERDWEAAMSKSDDGAVGKIIADNWVSTGPDGSNETKAQFLSEVKSGNYSTVKLDNIDVHTVGGSIAIATGKASDKDGRYSYMDVFQRQGGGWKCIASALSKIG